MTQSRDPHRAVPAGARSVAVDAGSAQETASEHGPGDGWARAAAGRARAFGAAGCLLAALTWPAPASPAGPGRSETALLIRVDPAARVAETGPKPVVASLGDAVALLRRRRAGAGGQAVIELAGGVHRLAQAVRIEADLGGQPGRPLVLRGAPDGSSRLSGSVPLERASDAPPPGLDPAVRGRVVGYRLPAAAAAQPSVGVRRTHTADQPNTGVQPVRAEPSPLTPMEFFDADGALVPARWPNAGWARVAVAEAGQGAEGGPVIRVPDGRADRWVDETDLWVGGYLGHDYSFETLPAVSAVRGSNRLALVGRPLYTVQDGDRYVVEHALAELDVPGEWWRDAGRGLVYLLPRRPGPIEVSVAPGLIEIAGASHVRLEGLTFEHSRGDAVTVTGGADVVVEDCTLRWIGGRGLVVDGAARSGMRRSVVTDTGEGGVALTGGDRARLTPGENFVEDSVFARFSRLGRTYKDAVSVNGVGMRVTGNLMAHAPHLAVRFQGNDHEITFNEVFDVARESSDVGVFYTGRDVAAQGTRLRGNFLHDVQAQPGHTPEFDVRGIYLDDMASGMRVEANLFLRVQQPVFIGGGRDNAVIGNVFVDSPPAVTVDGRGVVWAGPPITSSDNGLRAAFDAVPASRPPWSTRYPKLAGLLADEPLVAKRNTIRDNTLVASGEITIGQGAEPRRQTVADNRTRQVPGAADARTPAAVADAFKAAGLALDLPVDRMDRVAVLSRDPALKRRAGALLSRDGAP
ncbi:right-handed parallel beta-helix repeat-containing protein [Methylobacterium sp. NEAU 140]|uniref:right-handed parallel beta-helix repeat-containing protein n=1 Tax=Methylobacterium sp. NEAU 140 TaxID=3064945 RepID=UPI002736FB64|nr:right-handed parallel beta-helix repeat-containing protein [Methylobacterium sp. NEAU 140]MDP4025287.1 right-handed parallel beta-helix repeat-containing protein [Methylobacterium sp. NEAU 140]